MISESKKVPPAIAVERVDHVTVDVTDIDRAKQFYGGLFGLTEVPRPPSFTFPGAWYQVGPVFVHLVVKPQPDPDSPRHFCVWVQDVHAAADSVAQAGFAVQWDDFKIPGVDRFFTADPDGNRLEVQGAER
ncbi:MAG: VOC family protein [Planctomycetota bacterium]